MIKILSVIVFIFLQVLPPLCNANSANCYWEGTAPNCESSCQPGEYVAGTSTKHNGTNCTSGQRRYCCSKKNDTISPLLTRRPMMAFVTIPIRRLTTTTPRPTNEVTLSTIATSTLPSLSTNLMDGACRWVGEGPNCTSACRPGERVAAVSSEGEGSQLCKFGSRKYCCRIVIRRRLTPKPTPELPTQKLHDVSVSDTAIGESTTVLPMLSTDSADNKNLSKTMQANTTANPAPFASTPSTLSALTVLTTTKFPVGLRNLTASENQDLTTQNTRITTASQVASFPPISDSLPVKKDTDLPATVNVTSSNSVNSTVKKGPKIRPTLPPLPIVPLIFRNFRALNNSSVNTVP